MKRLAITSAALIAALALAGCTSTPSVNPPASSETAASDASSPDETAETGGADGSRNAPYPIGSTITSGEWTVVVNSFNPDATAEILAESQFNDPPAEGSVYALANITGTYTGDDKGLPAAAIQIAFVTESGNTINSYDTFVIVPEPLDSLGELYAGASSTGNIVLEIPAGDAGLLRVTPGMFEDDVFVTLK